LEAVELNKKITWNKSQSPDDQKEFERLKKDGHVFLDHKRNFTSLLNIENVRNTQLYRTLLHEFGHYVHYLEVVERAGNDDDDFEEWETRDDSYHKIQKDVKEKYAHKYADELFDKLLEKKIVPFDML
jgi:predicted SprT family Zn-dependent metalloprotease